MKTYVLKDKDGKIKATAESLSAIYDAKIIYNLPNGTIEETHEEVIRAEDDFMLQSEYEKHIKSQEYTEKQTEVQQQARINEIKAELIELDNKTIRPLRAGETEKLEELEIQAKALREELKTLESEE